MGDDVFPYDAHPLLPRRGEQVEVVDDEGRCLTVGGWVSQLTVHPYKLVPGAFLVRIEVFDVMGRKLEIEQRFTKGEEVIMDKIRRRPHTKIAMRMAARSR